MKNKNKYHRILLDIAQSNYINSYEDNDNVSDISVSEKIKIERDKIDGPLLNLTAFVKNIETKTTLNDEIYHIVELSDVKKSDGTLFSKEGKMNYSNSMKMTGIMKNDYISFKVKVDKRHYNRGFTFTEILYDETDISYVETEISYDKCVTFKYAYDFEIV